MPVVNERSYVLKFLPTYVQLVSRYDLFMEDRYV